MGNALWQHGWSSHVLPVLMNTRSRRRRRVPAVTPTRVAAEKQRRMAIERCLMTNQEMPVGIQHAHGMIKLVMNATASIGELKIEASPQPSMHGKHT